MNRRSLGGPHALALALALPLATALGGCVQASPVADVAASNPAGDPRALELCRQAGQAMLPSTEGLSVVADDALLIEGDATNEGQLRCTWASAGAPVLGLSVVDREDTPVLDLDNPLYRTDPRVQGGAVIVGAEGDTLAEVGGVSAHFPERTLGLTIAGQAGQQLLGETSVTDAVGLLVDVSGAIAELK
ncbi:hypothetical protein [Galactobacter valiniphilus]|uniref:hypothetical protein n=1 Tax=Galactobacter valiniphilus TaxID=2676122 RepID=UPI003736A4E7